MSRKTLFNIIAGALFASSAIFLFVLPMLYGSLNRNALSWANIIVLALLSLVFFVNAFLPDLIPNIFLCALFALLAIISFLELINYFKNFINYFEFYSSYGLVVSSIADFLSDILQLIAFGGIALLVLFKDNFGHLFFAPAIAATISAIINTISAFGIFTANFYFPSLINFLFIVFYFILAGALFVSGSAIVED